MNTSILHPDKDGLIFKLSAYTEKQKGMGFECGLAKSRI